MSQYFQHPNRAGIFPPVIQALLIGNGIVFLLELAGGMGTIVQHFALWPLNTPGFAQGSMGLERVPQFHVWQLVTYAFIHGGLLHIFLNMFALWMFGSLVEITWGSRRFLIYYFVCVIGAAAAQLLVTSGTGDIYPTIGASGGVFGILLAFGLRFPDQYILLLIPPIPIKAKYFVLIYGAIELYLGVTGTQEGVAHFAHLGGMATGFVMIAYWRGWLPIKPRRRMM